ncbi:MAG: NO-inducible flavohemoprotein [Desulfovibrionaceae bacterium]|nr:NO-inducible flavohemoprotein [Desulfovibrionaceae bacterium]
MLTPAQIELVKATVPVLREHGVALTTHFYKRMLSGNPELRHIFNSAHQAGGKQQKALAAAVLAYAENIENLAVLLPAVRQIAVKHCTIGVRAEQYGIVGRHLLASIKEVLGDAATDELIDAWAAAYGLLADVLIKAEGEIYSQQAMADGGWSGWRPFRIASIKEECADVKSFCLTPADGGPLPSFVPGQFVSVRVFVKEISLAQPRQYTITAMDSAMVRITVRHVPSGRVSGALHGMREGDVVELSAPLGDFNPVQNDAPAVFLSAGIGITPMVSMLAAAAAGTPDKKVCFVYVCRGPESFPLRAEVEKSVAAMPGAALHVFYTRSDAAGCFKNGRLAAADYAAVGMSADAEYYICGPVSFMAEHRQALLAYGVPAERIHMEVFGTGDMA